MHTWMPLHVVGPHRFTVYDLGTGPRGKPGRILRIGGVANVYDLANQCQQHEGWVPDHPPGDDTKYMVDPTTKQFVPKPMLNIPPEVTVKVGESLTLGVPAGTKVCELGKGETGWEVRQEASPQFQITEKRSFRLQVRPPWPYREEMIKVIVTD